MISFQKSEFHPQIIGVCGASVIDADTYQIAEELGRIIAQKGYILACGGLGGTMEAVCKGAKSAGGLTIGILPNSSKERANPYVDIVIPTGIGEARNRILISTVDGIITISGGAGTLSEIAFAWKANIPIVSLSSTGGWSARLANTKIDSTRSDEIVGVLTPNEAVDQLILKFNQTHK
jgi:hypothetical protein